MQWPRFSSVVVYTQFMWTEFVSVLPVSFHSTRVTYLYHHIWQVWDRPLQLLCYHSFYTYFLAFPLTGILLEFTYLCWEICFHYCLYVVFHVTVKRMFPHFLCRSLFWDMWMSLNNMHFREWVNKYFACGCSLLPVMCLLVSILPCLFWGFAATGSSMRLEVTLIGLQNCSSLFCVTY